MIRKAAKTEEILVNLVTSSQINEDDAAENKNNHDVDKSECKSNSMMEIELLNGLVDTLLKLELSENHRNSSLV